jgi:hypothetical protein
MKYIIVLFTVTLSFNLFCQNKIQGSLGINYPVVVDGSDIVLYEYWKIGINGGVTAHCKILDALNFRPGISYQYLFFHKYAQYLSYGPGAVNSSGTGSHILKLGGELHLGDGEENRTRFSIFVGGGCAMERPGTMTITWADSPNSSTGKLPNRHYWYGSAGINLDFSVTKDFSIGTSIKYLRNKAEADFPNATDDTIWMVNCSILYDFMQF